MRSSDDVLVLRGHGGTDVGAGHLMRLKALASAWMADGGTAVLVCPDLNPEFKASLLAGGMKLHPQRAEPGGAEDAAELLGLVGRCGAAWVAIDGYIFSEDFFVALGTSPVKMLVIDDNFTLDPPGAQIVVDPSFQALGQRRVGRSAAAIRLLGPQYAFLRPEFRCFSVRRPAHQDAPFERLLVTMGGSDPSDVSAEVLGLLSRSSVRPAEIVLVAGGLNPRPDNHFHARLAPGQKLTVVRNIGNMAEVMAGCDAAISAGGASMHELAAVGLPALLVAVADNQVDGVKHVANQGLFAALPSPHETPEPQMLASLEDWLRTPRLARVRAGAARALVDGRGPERICSSMDSLS